VHTLVVTTHKSYINDIEISQVRPFPLHISPPSHSGIVRILIPLNMGVGEKVLNGGGVSDAMLREWGLPGSGLGLVPLAPEFVGHC
jgi:hypothetical protein